METETDRKKILRCALAPLPNISRRDYPIIVHSHLGWDWVWQRPQQFLSRLSKKHRILFVEGPFPSESVLEPQVTLREVPAHPNITVLQTPFPASRWHEGDWVDAERLRLVRSVLAGPLGAEFSQPVQWFYDPMAVRAFAGQMDEIALVYDCMDELSQFKGAPPELVKRERQLLALADVVFAGGPKIHRAKAPYHSNCHAYGCGVDERHFGQARNGSAVTPGDIAHLKGPVLGFFGVVDERMDYELIARLADADSSWQIVIVGPHTKIEDVALPQRPNLHWLGGRNYTQLPHYASRFNVCLMPFALNAATEFINPTKALEYMATGRPVVSSAIEDVVLQFNQVVAVAYSHGDFIKLCRRALQVPDPARLQRGIELARKNSWETIVKNLEWHIDEVLAARKAQAEGDAA
ncbi:MAG: glycosyltransferase [Verrucomicrobia bacterium]|nr:glycosyltransferase [Verrucomicrobiota bacterium]